MSGRKITKVVLVATVLLLGVYDLIAALGWGAGATLSRIVGFEASQAPAVPFAIGFVMGHLFWHQKAALPTAPELPVDRE
jgi:hypothetical protein